MFMSESVKVHDKVIF